MKKSILCISVLTMMNAVLLFPFNTRGQTPYPATTKLSEIIGIVHMNGKYRFNPSKDFMKEGVDEIEAMGTNVIKLFMGRSTDTAYPSYWGNNWPTFTNLTALAQTSYFQDAFNRTQFKTYVLTTHEMTNGGAITNFKDGVSATEETNLYNEFYNLTTHLYNTYNNTGKTFILANWEGDGLLGFVYDNPLPSVAVQDARINGMIKWFQIRQDAITDARNAAIIAGKTNVSVVGAAEFNHVSTTGYAWPTMLDRVVPSLNMDLYSFSNWKTNRPSIIDDFNTLLTEIKDKCPSSTLYGANNIYLGETGTFELSNVTGSSIPAHTDYSDRLSREVMQRNTELALKFGLRYIIHWELYCNGLRPGVTLPAGQNATENQLVGVGIKRADGSYAGTYTYYKSIMSKTLGEYLHVYEAEAQVTSTSSGDTHEDILLAGASGQYFSKLNANAVGDWAQFVIKQTQKGLCSVKVKIRKGPTYGKFKLSIGSQTINTVIDCYNTTNTFAEVDLGLFQFSNNPGTINYNYRFTVDGKTGLDYDLGIDAIEIIPTSGQYFNAISSVAPSNKTLDFVDMEKEDAVFSDFSFYPNPATNSIFVKFKNSNYTLNLFDLSGRKVMEKECSTDQQEIDISSLERGIYMMSINFDGKTITRKVLLK